MTNELQTVVLTTANFPFLSIRQGIEAAQKIASVMDDFDSQMHIVSCSGLKHYQDCGDLTVLTSIVKAVSKYNSTTGQFDGRSVRSKDLRQWLTNHADIKWDKTAYKDATGTARGGYVKGKVGPAEVKLEHAIATPFYTAKEAVSRDLVDIRSIADAAFGRISKAIKDGKVPEEQKALAVKAQDALRPFIKVKKAS